MGICNIDHTHADVVKKLRSQEPFLPAGLGHSIHVFLGEHRAQETLNELFHLLKKYDLATIDERATRNTKLESLIE